MKIPKDLYNEKSLEALSKAGIVLDFGKDYSDDELADLEMRLKDACLDFGFDKGKPNKDCTLWEKICDDFVEVLG